MITEFLNSLEDARRPLLGPNFWILTKIGLLLPDKIKPRIGYIIIHEIVTFFVITQLMELYIIRADLDQVLINIKITMLSIVCIIKSNTFVFWQARWRKVIDYVTEADKEEREQRDEAKGKILDTYTKYCKRVTYFYWVLVFITFITVTYTPLIRYLSSETYRAQLRNGTELFPHIFSAWMPIDKYHPPGSWITVIWHVILCAYGAAVMAAYDTNVVVIMVFFGGKLELLRERCKQMLGDGTARLSEDEVDKKVKQLHDIHVTIMKFSREFNSLLSPVMFLYVVICSLMLCASAFQLTSATNTTQKVLMAEYFVFGIAQLFMFCWHSNGVLIKSERLVLGPYESEWWRASLRTRRCALMLAGQMRITHTFTAGPFTQLTLSTFIAILKGSYSYYTLLRK